MQPHLLALYISFPSKAHELAKTKIQVNAAKHVAASGNRRCLILKFMLTTQVKGKSKQCGDWASCQQLFDATQSQFRRSRRKLAAWIPTAVLHESVAAQRTFMFCVWQHVIALTLTLTSTSVRCYQPKNSNKSCCTMNHTPQTERRRSQESRHSVPA